MRVEKFPEIRLGMEGCREEEASEKGRRKHHPADWKHPVVLLGLREHGLGSAELSNASDNEVRRGVRGERHPLEAGAQSQVEGVMEAGPSQDTHGTGEDGLRPPGEEAGWWGSGLGA